MNVTQFKSWFEGFCENIDGIVTVDQWEKVKNKIKILEESRTNPYPQIRNPNWPLDKTSPYTDIKYNEVLK